MAHGRVKVKTTEEQQEAKRKEREKKLQLYKAATELVFGKRQKKELDEEGLKVAGEILGANPDFYTLWNFRREVFLHLMTSYAKEDLQTLFTQELKFLETCLQVNPKSYGVWHHRTWVMTHMPDPDWTKEVKLCGMFLEYDERNFHCWDYRRFVVLKAQILANEELLFSTNKIKTNFSNYSSWHYRSKLLPLLFPDTANAGRPTESVLLQEYELVQNAFFTDPNDQSAWFYHRWLLGRSERCQSIQAMYFNRKERRLFITLTKPENLLKETTAEVYANGIAMKGTWQNSLNENVYSLTWIFNCNTEVISDDSLTIKVQLRRKDEELSSVERSPSSSDEPVIVFNSSYQEDAESLFTSEMSAEKAEVLKAELESCQQLQEIEEENKWCVLTIIFLMRAINPVQYEKEVISYFDTLIKSDPYRRNYFKDLRSKFLVENAIIKWRQSPDSPVDLQNKQLSNLYHMNHLATQSSLDLSNNELTNLKGCSHLQALQTFIIDDNQLEDICEIGCLQWLQNLSIQNNNICSISQLSALTTCKHLESLDLRGNQVCNIPSFQEEIRQLTPSLLRINDEVL